MLRIEDSRGFEFYSYIKHDMSFAVSLPFTLTFGLR